MNIYDTIEATLKAPVPTSILDSGGAYGYQFQRNQQKNLPTNPRVSYDIWEPRDRQPNSADISAYVDIYHYLTDTLHIDETSKRLNKQLRQREIHWTGEAIEYLETLPNVYDIGNEINTYNGEQILSQVLQFFTFELEESTSKYVALQIHGGCDVRGGYSDCQVFEIDMMDADLFGYVDIYGDIDGTQVSTSYNGYSLVNEETGEPVPLKIKDGEITSTIYLDYII